CLTEYDGLIVCEFDKSSSDKIKMITMDIDLDVHVVPEAEEEEIINEVKKIKDYESVEKMAAEAVVVMIGIFNQQDQVGYTSELVAGLPEEFQEGDMVDAFPRMEHKSGIRRGVWDPRIKHFLGITLRIRWL
nr:hypothetical protein [Tanacetum cinerariifolium]